MVDVDLIELVARVSRLEAAVALPPEGGPPATESDSETFWVLEGLRGRQPLPSVAYAGHVLTAAGDPVDWQMTHLAADVTDADWASAAQTLGALGHPARLHILQLVARGEAHTAADLAHTDGLGSTGQIYHHLRQLVAGGWLRVSTKGRHEVPPERLVPLLVVLAASR